MRRKIGVVVFLLFITFLRHSFGQQQVNSFSDLYLLSKDSQGEPFCLIDTPSAVYNGVRSRLRCLVKCSESNPECMSANYHDVTRKCELFYYPSVLQPLKIADQCKNYKNKDTPTAADLCKPTGDNSTFPPQCCSFPFTYQGQIYYSCAKNGCYRAQHTWVKCDQSVSFTAGYVKANVIIPNIVQPAATTFIQGWLIIHFNALSAVGEFGRTWVEYRDGFGDLDGTHYWYGNEKVHQLTSSGSWKLRVEVLSSSNSKWFSAEYESFWLSDEASKYKLNVTGYWGDAGDSFNDGLQAEHHANGMKFSTSDSDNDNYLNGNCAYGLGWWMNWCGSSILTKPGQTNEWYSLHSTKMAPNYLVSKARMMIRPNNY